MSPGVFPGAVGERAVAATINLKKLVQVDASHVLESLIDSLGGAVLVSDSGKRPLLGDENAAGQSEFPVWLAGRTIGWVKGPPDAYCLAAVLSHMAEQELEKRELTARVLDRESEISLLHEIHHRISSSVDVREIAAALVDEATANIESTAASVMLIDQETGLLKVAAAFGPKSQDRPALKPGVGIAGDVVLTGVPEIVNDAKADPRFVPGAHPVCSLICAPIISGSKIIGAINVSNSSPMNYRETDIRLAVTLSAAAGSSIEKARLISEMQPAAEPEPARPSCEIIRRLCMNNGDSVTPGDSLKEDMSVMFAGMRDHMEHFSSMTTRENFLFLNDYIECISGHVRDNGGFMKKCYGDCTMNLFPENGSASAERAVLAAIEMQKSLRKFSEKRRKAGNLPVFMGLGIHSGPVSVGALNLESGIQGAALGDSLKTAARLEHLAKLYGLRAAISDGVYDNLSGRSGLGIREVDMVVIPGMEKTITVYDLYSADPEGVGDAKHKNLRAYEQALELFRNREWEEAARSFESLRKAMPFDKTVIIHFKRCLSFLKAPPSDSWTGVTRLADY